MIKPRTTAERAKHGSSEINDLARTTDNHGRLVIDGTRARIGLYGKWSVVVRHPWSVTDARTDAWPR